MSFLPQPTSPYVLKTHLMQKFILKTQFSPQNFQDEQIFLKLHNMAPRSTQAPPKMEPDSGVIHNHRSKGLGIYDRSQVFHQLSNFNIKFVSELKDQKMDLMGYLWALKVRELFVNSYLLIFVL